MATSDSWQRASTDAAQAHWGEYPAERAAEASSAPVGKRLLDLAVSGAGLVALAPAMVAFAAAVKLESPGPVFYRGRRMGKDRSEFECLKFRTVTGDGNMTRVGGWLRRHGLDELPQLVNVLRGEMSVVGPRPVMAGERPNAAVGRYRRLEMQPGMTGLWAVQDVEGPLCTPYVSPDENYRAHWSAWRDVAIMARSATAALAGKS